MTSVSWRKPKAKTLTFNDLVAGDCFRLVTGEAVYMKVVSGRTGRIVPSGYTTDNGGFMLELATGKLWEKSHTAVEQVEVDIAIGVPKPSIY